MEPGSKPAVDPTDGRAESDCRVGGPILSQGPKKRTFALRLAEVGADALETRELLLLCLSEYRLHTPSSVCNLLDRYDVGELSRLTAEHLQRESGLSYPACARLVASFALGRRVEAAARRDHPAMRSPAQVQALLVSEIRGLMQEHFHVLLLDSKHRLRRRQRISVGTLTSSLVHPREVFAPAVREGAAAIIVAHNHPSGDPEPSAEDLAVTRRLVEAGRVLGIPLLDHVVLAEERCVSIRERISFSAS